jgi:hypothetical protein
VKDSSPPSNWGRDIAAEDVEDSSIQSSRFNEDSATIAVGGDGSLGLEYAREVNLRLSAVGMSVATG